VRVPDTLNIKVPPGLRKRLEEAARRNALSIQGEAARRLQASFKRRPRKHRGLQEYDRIIDLLVLAAVLKKPLRKARETVVNLSKKEPFKQHGDLLSRHNRLKKALIKRGKFKELEDGVRNRGLDLMVRYGPNLLSLEKALEVAKKRVIIFNAMKGLGERFLGFLDDLPEAYRKVYQEWSASPLGLQGAAEQAEIRLRAQNPVEWDKGKALGKALLILTEEPGIAEEGFKGVELSRK
jgi:hypothetical protein